MTDQHNELERMVVVVDMYHAEKKELKKIEKQYKESTALLREHIKISEDVLMDYLKRNDIKVVVSPTNVVEVKARKSTSISLSRLFAYSLGKLRSMKAFLAVVKPQIGKVKALYDAQALMDKGILTITTNNYHHLEVGER